MSSRRVIIRPAAEADLEALYTRVVEDSGLGIAGAYLARIKAACLDLAMFAERGAPRDEIEPGLRMLAFERRVAILYRVATADVAILRVLYGGRDFQNAVLNIDE